MGAAPCFADRLLSAGWLVDVQFTVLTAHSSKELVSRGEVAAVRWCGWHNILVDPRVCHVSLSPLQDQFLAVEPGEGGGLFTPGKACGNTPVHTQSATTSSAPSPHPSPSAAATSATCGAVAFAAAT